MAINEQVRSRFWSLVKIEGPDECWEWQRARMKAGYGVIGGMPGTTLLSHRVAWEITNGEIPKGKCICHRCDNPPCCNPKHLFLGSYADNVHDMEAKGRRVNAPLRGEKHWNVSLSDQQVSEIREKYKSTPASTTSLAIEFRVSPTQIGRIIRGVRGGLEKVKKLFKAKNKCVKQTPETEERIRFDRHVKGMTFTELVFKYKIGQSSIANICNRASLALD